MACGTEAAGLAQRLRNVFPNAADKVLIEEKLASKDYAGVEAMLFANVTASDTQRECLLGAIAFLSGNVDQSAAHFAKSSLRAPLAEADTFTWAMASVKRNDTQTALTLLSGLAMAHPDRAIYAYWLGRINYDLRRYEEAIAKLRQATTLDPASARAWNALGLALDMAGQPDAALEPLQKAANLNRKAGHPSPWPPHDLGGLYLRSERWQQAEASLAEALTYDDSMSQAHYHLGRALEKMGRSAEAINEYKRAIATDLKATESCYSLAMLYRKLGRETDVEGMLSLYRKRKAALAAVTR